MRRKPTLYAVLLWALGLLWTGGALPAQAKPSDPRLEPVETYFSCIAAIKALQSCKPKTFLVGEALRTFAYNKAFITKFRMANRGYVELVASSYMAYHKKWLEKTGEALKKAGYRTEKLPQLGTSKAVVSLGPRVALAMFWVTVQPRGKGSGMTRYGLFVLWQVDPKAKRWKIASTPQPSQAASILATHRPPWFPKSKKDKADKAPAPPRTPPAPEKR